MTTQKEIDEMLINLLESISQICDKTTSGNVSHNIATIKYKCRDMLQFYKQHPVTHWHSVKEGKIPQVYARCLFNSKTELYKGFMAADKLLYFDDSGNQKLNIYEIDYWMEIPKLPTE